MASTNVGVRGVTYEDVGGMRGCWLNYPEGAIGTEDHPEIIHQKSINCNSGENYGGNYYVD